MKIECLTTFKDTDNGTPATFHLGDVLTVSDEDGARFCAAGWAKDTSGQVPTAEPTGGASKLDIHNAAVGQSASNVGA
jgi:hypothetical protein